MNTKIPSLPPESVPAKTRQVMRAESGEELLDLYSRQTRKAGVDYGQAQTIRNKRMLVERDPIVLRSNLKERWIVDARFAPLCKVRHWWKPPGGTSRVIEKEVELRLREVQP
jgi:hypothetical protein